MEKMVENKKSKGVLIILILLTMLSAYVPKISFADNDSTEYVKFKANWTNETDEFDTISNKNVYLKFDIQLSGGVTTGFRNVKLRAENFYETPEDSTKPIANIKINPTAYSSEIVNGSTSSTLEFESPLNAGTAISGDMGIFVNTRTYESFEPFVKKIKVTLSGEYQDPITKEIKYVENIIQPKILTLNVTPEQKVTDLNSYVAINEIDSGAQIYAPHITIDNSHALEEHTGASCGWYASQIIGEYKVRVNTTELAQQQILAITIKRIDSSTKENRLNYGYNVNWGELEEDFGTPVKTTNEQGFDVYTFTKGTDSETFNQSNIFAIANKTYNVNINYTTGNSEGSFETEKSSDVTLLVDSTVIGWKKIENSDGISTEKKTIKTSKVNTVYLGLSHFTPGAHSWMSVSHSPSGLGTVTNEELQNFKTNGTIDLKFTNSSTYIIGSQNSTQSGMISYVKPTLEYYSDDKTIKTIELDADTMRLKSIDVQTSTPGKTIDVFNGEEEMGKCLTGESYIVPENININEFKIKLNEFMSKNTENGYTMIHFGPYSYEEQNLISSVIANQGMSDLHSSLYNETFTLSLQKLKDAGLSDTEIDNIVAINVKNTTSGDWFAGGDTARYTFNDSDAFKKSYLEMDLGEYNCDTRIEDKTIKLSMYKNSDVIINRDVVVKNENPKIYVQLSDGFNYQIKGISITQNPNITIKESSLVRINGSFYVCIECMGTYDSSKMGRIGINIDLRRKLTDDSLDERQKIVAYMITDNENYFTYKPNSQLFSKGEVVPDNIYYMERSYNITKTDSIKIGSGLYTQQGNAVAVDAKNNTLTKNNPQNFLPGEKIKYLVQTANGKEAINNISMIYRLPFAGNKGITNKSLDLGSTITTTNLENITVYERYKSSIKKVVDPSKYTIKYSNNELADKDTVFDSDYSGYTNGIADVKSFKIEFNSDYSLSPNTLLSTEYEMTMPNDEGITGQTVALYYKKGTNPDLIELEPAAAYIQNGEPTGTIKVQKKFQDLAVGVAPEGVSLANINFKFINMITGETLITPGTDVNGIVKTDSTGLAVFTKVPQGQYQLVEDSIIPGYSGIGGYYTTTIDNDEIEEMIVENMLTTIPELIIKKEWTDTNEQQGQVVFMLKSKDTGSTYQVSQKTDEFGIAKFVGVPYGKYELTETSGVYGWYLEPQEVIINDDTSVVIADNKLGTASLKIKKTVPIGDTVQGLKFNIIGTGYVRYTDKTGVLKQTDYSKTITIGDDYSGDTDVNIEISEDNKTATITLSKLYLGEYVVEEIQMPKIGETDVDRYIPVKRTIALKQNAKVEELNLSNRWRQGYIKIEKTAKLKNSNGEFQDIGDLSGFKVRITGTSIYGTEVNEIIKLDEDGNSAVEAIEVGEYTITEEPVDGYTPYYTVTENGTETQTVVAPKVKIEYGETVTQKIYNEHTGVGYVKVVKSLQGVTNPQKIVDAGIKFKVVGKNIAGGKVEEIININRVDIENGVAYGISGPISVGGEYQLEEIDTTVPKYFEGIEPQEVKLTTAATESNPLVFDVENKRTKGNLEIVTQTKPEGGPLTGIKYKVTEVEIKSDGTYQTIGEPIELDGNNDAANPSYAEIKQINSGNYLVEQVIVPDGWKKDVNQIIEVPSYTTGYVVFEITKQPEMVDTKVVINKEILNKDGEQATIDDFVDAKLREDESFEVKVKNVDTNEEYYTFISNAKNGIITGLLPGTYEIEESYKPKYSTQGYYKLEGGIAPIAMEQNSNEKYEFTLVDSTSEVEITIKNRINVSFPFGGQKRVDNMAKYDISEESDITSVTKTLLYIVNENDEALPGAVFKLLDMDGQVVTLSSSGTELTTVNRKLTINGLPIGVYTLSCVSVPEGYLKPADRQIEVFEKATRIARVEIQKNIPRGSVSLFTTYENLDNETKYVPRSKYKVVNPITGEVLRFTKTMTGDYIKSELEDASTEINLKSGPVEVTGIEVGTYEFGLTGMTDGYGMKTDLPETVTIEQDAIQNVNVGVIKQKVKQISAGNNNTMYLDENGDLWIFGNQYGTKPYKIVFPEGIKIDKFEQGEYHTIAIDTQGKIWIWNVSNPSFSLKTYGVGEFMTEAELKSPFCLSNQIGNPFKSEYDKGVKVVDVVCNNNSSLALDSEGKVWYWGNWVYGNEYYPVCLSKENNLSFGKAYSVGIKVKKIFSNKDTYNNYQCLDSAGRLWGIKGSEIKCLTEEIEGLFNINIVDSCINYLIDDKGDLWKVYDDSRCEQINYTKIDMSIFNNAKLCKIVYRSDYFGWPVAALDENGNVWLCNTSMNIVRCISNNIHTKISDIDFAYWSHIIALGENGSMYGLGYSPYGELGAVYANYSYESDELFKINIDYTESLDYNIKFTKIEDTVAIDENGKIWSFDQYASGDGIRASNGRVQNLSHEDFLEIDNDHDIIFAVTKSGKLYVWGNNSYGARPSNIAYNSDYQSLAIDITSAFDLEDGVKIVSASGADNANYYSAIDSLGRVWMWGKPYNSNYGLLGTGDIETLSNPVCISDDEDEALYNVKIVKVALSYYCAFALDENGKLWTWGYMPYSGLAESERETFGIKDIQKTPICLSDIVGTDFYNEYREEIKFVDISAYSGTNLPSAALDSEGRVWILQGYGADSSKGYFKCNFGNPDCKIVFIKCCGSGTYCKDIFGNMYSLGGNMNSYKIEVKNIIDVSASGFIGADGQIYDWNNIAKYNAPEDNNLYNKKIDKIINEEFLQLDSDKGEIYYNDTFEMFSEKYLENVIGQEIQKSDCFLYRDSRYNYSYFVAIDKRGKVWTWGSNKFGNLGKGNTENDLIDYKYPQCISDIQGLKLNEAYNNNPDFKIVDMKLYSGTSGGYSNYGRNTVLLDNQGKIWTCGNGSPINGNTTLNTYEFNCISDIDGTELKQKYDSDETFKIVDINTFNPEYGFMFTDSNGDVWQYYYSSTTNTPVCISSSMISKPKKVVSYRDPGGRFLIFLIDQEGKVWGYGGGSNYCYYLQGWQGGIKTVPYKLSDSMSGITDIYVGGYAVIAYGENNIWVWGNSTDWGESSGYQYTPKQLSTELTINKVVGEGILIDTDGKVWTMGSNSQVGYNTDTSYNPLTCISDDINEMLFGVKIVDSYKIESNSFLKYSQNIKTSDYILISDSGEMYNLTYNYSKDREPIYKLDGQYNKFNQSFEEYLGDLKGKNVKDLGEKYVIDSEGNLYNITSYLPTCITSVKYLSAPIISSNNILLNNPIPNQLKGLKFKELYNDQIVKDINDNYWYFPKNEYYSKLNDGRAINLTEKINNYKNNLYGKTIKNVINNKYVVTSENEIYSTGGSYIMNYVKDIEIKDVYYSFDSTGYEYYMVLDTNGKIWTCGYGKFGTLGNGKNDSIKEPVCLSDIEGTSFNNAYKQDSNFKIEKICGSYSTQNNVNSIIALDSNGKIWSWGYNPDGQLGNGTTMYSNTPICISDIADTELNNVYKNDVNFKIQSIQIKQFGYYYQAAGFAIDNNGKVWTWGNNTNGQLGNGNTDNVKSPICISNIEGNVLSQLGNEFKVIQAELISNNLYLLGNNGKVYKSDATGIKCLDENISGITNLSICRNSLSSTTEKIIAYGENAVWEITGTPYQISLEITPKEIVYINSNIIILDISGKIWTYGPANKYLGFESAEPVTTSVCISDKETSLLYNKQIIDIAKTREKSGYNLNVVALDSNGKIYEWGSTIDMNESNRIDTVVQTVYGDSGPAHKMELFENLCEFASVPLYKLENGKCYKINYASNSIKFDDVIECFKNEYTMSQIEEVLDSTHVRTKDGLIYNLFYSSAGEGVFVQESNYIAPTLEENISRITIPGANIVSQTKYKALDDQGNLYVWDMYTGGYNSTIKPVCTSEGDYVVEPIYSTGNGWTASKRIF